MRLSTFAAGLFSLSLAVLGCSSSDTLSTTGTGGSSGTGGSGGSSGGSGGSSSTGGTSGDAGTPTFMAVAPCAAATDYTEGTTIMFPGTANSGLSYSPACLKVKVGASVTFSGTFSGHFLSPSKTRGNKTDNPIKETMTGTSASFTFSKAGYYAYYCEFHGSADDGSAMAGVVWVTP